MTVIKKGMAVIEVPKVLRTGIVTGYNIDQETGERQYRVSKLTLKDGKPLMIEDHHFDADENGVEVPGTHRTEMVPVYDEFFAREGEIEIDPDGDAEAMAIPEAEPVPPATAESVAPSASTPASTAPTVPPSDPAH